MSQTLALQSAMASSLTFSLIFGGLNPKGRHQECDQKLEQTPRPVGQGPSGSIHSIL